MFGARILLVLAAVAILAGCGSPQERAANYITRAQELYAAGDYVKARLEAQNAVQVEPKNAKARFLLAEIAEQQQDYQQMFGHLLVAVAADPLNAEARLKLGMLYFLGRSWDEAAMQVKELRQLAPNDARVRLLQARVLLQKGDREAGMAEIVNALKIDPNNLDGILLRSAGYAIDNPDKGIAILDAAIVRLPDDQTRPLRELRVAMLAQSKRTEEVEQSLRELLEDFPTEHGYQFQLAQFFASQGRVDEAEELLKRVTELDPTNVESQIGYVQFLITERNTGEAEGALKLFISQTPDAGKLRLALGELYETGKRPDEARKAYAELGERAPKSVEGVAARNRIAAIDVRAGRIDDARSTLDRILAEIPDDAAALLLRAGLRFNDNKFDEAIADLRLVLSKKPNNETALLLLAHSYVRRNNLVLAKDIYRRLLEAAPDSPDGLLELAVLYGANKEYAEGEALLRRRLEKQPEDLIASARLVEMLTAMGETADAEGQARRMIDLPDQAGIGDFLLGRVLAQKKDFNAAAAAFRQSMAVRSDDPLPLEGLVQALLADGKRGEAITVLNQQLTRGQNRLLAGFLLGGVYARAGDQGKARQYLEEVVKERPDSVIAWTSLAGTYPERNARIGVYQRAIAAVPASTELLMQLANEYEQSRRFDDAMRAYEDLLKTAPTHAPAINNLAVLLLDQRSDQASHARALKLATALVGTKEPTMLDTLGWAHYRARQYNEAVSLLERVVARAGQVPVFRYHLGMAYLGAGNRVGAKQQLREAVKDAQGDYPGVAEARAVLAKLNKPS